MVPLILQASSELRICIQGAESVSQALSKATSDFSTSAPGQSSLREDSAGKATPNLGPATTTSSTSAKTVGDDMDSVDGLVSELLADLEVSVSEHDVASACTILAAGGAMLRLLSLGSRAGSGKQAALLGQVVAINSYTLRDRLDSALEDSRLVRLGGTDREITDGRMIRWDQV